MTAEVSPRRHNSPLRQAQAAATRLRIIEAAHAEFEAAGYEGTRIEDVAARAGVAVPTVYDLHQQAQPAHWLPSPRP
jgi:AcrR family transcriptional regulator